MKNAKNQIRLALRAGWPALLVGPPGIGKTAICHQIAEEENYNFLVEVATTADPSDARGLPAVIDGKADYQPYGLMRQLVEAEEPTLCLIDDLGHATGEVQKAYMHLILARRAGQYHISPRVRFVAATNDVGQKAGVASIISPLQNRMFQIHVSPHVGAWVEWAQENKIHPEVIGFVRSTPTLFDKFIPPVGIEAVCTQRSLQMLSDFLSAGASTLPSYQGCIGKTVGMQFSAYRELYKELPHIAKILANPKKAPLPDQLDRRYGLCAAIACETENWDKLIIYVGRLPMELQVMCISDAVARHPVLKQEPNIKIWMKQNKDVLL